VLRFLSLQVLQTMNVKVHASDAASEDQISFSRNFERTGILKAEAWQTAFV
jgi:hypothetical protein